MIINKQLCEVLDIIYKNEKINVGQISKQLDISQPLTSRRLAILRYNKFVLYEKVVNHVYYKINPDKLDDVKYLLSIYKDLP